MIVDRRLGPSPASRQFPRQASRDSRATRRPGPVRPPTASALALLRSAVARQLAAREIAEADAMTRGRVPRDRAAEADLDVVRMRAEDQKVNGGHFRHDSPL